MKIIELRVENVKRIEAVTICPEGNVVTISGKNGAGKSSVLDAIAMALGGKDLACPKPVRSGQKSASVRVTLDDLVITRTFTESGGGSLAVANKEGAKYPSPQAVLDKLVGKLSFDPLEFARQPDKKQMETLRALVGLDFTAIEQERANIYAQRTQANAFVQSLKAQVSAAPSHGDAPAQEVSVSALMDELDAAQDANVAVASARQDWVRSGQNELNIAQEAKAVQEKIDELTSRLSFIKARAVAAAEATEKLRSAKDVMAEIATDPIKLKISQADTVNRKVRENAHHAGLSTKLEDAVKKAKKLDGEIHALDDRKAKAMKGTKFPVDGLSFDDSGVTYKGIPFSQASSAEQLRVSVAMGMAMNPKLRVLLIRDGSLLDAEGMAMMAEMAAANDGQVWIERVADGSKVGIIIEEGKIRAETPEGGKKADEQ